MLVFTLQALWRKRLKWMKAMSRKSKIMGLCTAAGVLLLAGIGLCLWLSGCFGARAIRLAPAYQELFTVEEAARHRMILPEYDTDNTIAYLNWDGTKSLYVYASPIRYQNASDVWTLIDSRLASVVEESERKKGYAYTIASSDIVPYFPQKMSAETGIRLVKSIEISFGVDSDEPIRGQVREEANFIGEKKTMVSYAGAFGKGSRARFYPTSLGVNGEVTVGNTAADGSFGLWLEIPESKAALQLTNGGYLVLQTLEKDPKILAVIQKPLLRTGTGEIRTDGTVSFEKQGNGRYRLRISFGEGVPEGSTLFLSFEMRREKQPDNALYSGFPDLEYAYLRNYAVVGNSPDYGIGQLMIRYQFTQRLHLKAEDILKASYYTYSLTDRQDRLEMRTILEDWCSMTGNWNRHYAVGERTAFLESLQPELCFDITDEVQMWCGDPDGQLEHNGLLLKSADEQDGLYNVLLSNDNTLYRNRTEIQLK